MRRHPLAIDCGIVALLIALNLLVIAPFFTMNFSDQPWNNDYTYIGMSRMFRDRPWTWNSLQYGGAPFHYLYPPLFHLLVLLVPVRSLGRAYHIVSGISYAMAPAAFYIAALQLFRSRRLAAALAALESFSPTVLYFLLPSFSAFASRYLHGPWNFVTLIASNESAHTLSLALILLVLAAAWRDRWLVAALLSAAIFLTNWAGIIGLLMVLAAAAAARSRDLGLAPAALRVVGVAGIGYGLAAFWISPDCVYTTKLLDRVVLRNIQPSTPWNGITWMVLAGAAVVLAISLWPRIDRRAAFALALAAISGAVVVSYSLTGNYLLPLPHRYIQEFNVALILAIGCLAAAAWQWRKPLGGVVLALSALPALPFLPGAWTVQQPSADPHATLAFQISDWLARHADSSRVLVSGELEGALNIWANVPQPGGSAQGVSNYLIPAAARQVALECGPDARHIAELWLRALDVRYIVVHGAASAEHFHWFTDPERFAAWPAVWTNGRGDTIYQVPGQDEPQAVIVDLARMRQLRPLRATDYVPFLESYVAWAQGGRAAAIRWLTPGHAELQTEVGPNEAVLIKVNHDAGWRASAGTIGRDPIGFLLVKGPLKGRVTLRFTASGSQWLGRAITLATILLLLWRAPMWATASIALVPSVSAYAILLLHTPSTVAVAEQAYRRLQPPLISPAGIIDGTTYAQPPFTRGEAISIFGTNFGSAQDDVRAWIGGRPAEILYRGANQINVRLPADAPPLADVNVEVNGCRGNSFAVATNAP